MKKVLSILLTLTMLLGLCPVVFAEKMTLPQLLENEGTDESGYAYLLEMGEYNGNITGAKWYWPIHGFSSQSAAYKKITSSYGYRGGEFQRNHYGMDIGQTKGTFVYPVRNGTVITADNSISGATGRYIVIDHGDHYYSVYMHFSKISVSVGDKVTINTKIGEVGGSGNGSETCYGYHLHVGVHYGNSFNHNCNVNPCPNGYTRISSSGAFDESVGGKPIGTPSIDWIVLEDTALDILISGESKPSNVDVGSGFALYGTIYSSSGVLTSVTGQLLTITGTVVQEHTVYPNSQTYNLLSKVGTTASIDSSLKFGALNTGYYIYVLKALASSGSVNVSRELIRQNFTIGNPAPITYNVTYNANGGSGAPASQTKTHDVNLTLSSTKPTRTGYTFLGWTTSSTATSASYSAGGSFTANANTTLYAVWSPITYTITYNANGGSCSTATKSVTYASTYGTLPTPTRTGYAFAGWYTAASGGTQITASTTVSITANQTLYAHWTAYTYTITFNANGGSGAPSAQTKTYGVNLTLSSTKPTRSGYNFLGWSTSSTATSASYAAGASFTTNANTTLYAVWSPITYTVTFNANGGSGAPSAQTKTYGVTLTLSSTKPTRTGYNFLGWSTSSTAASASYAAGASFTTNANATLYAVWSPITYTVTFNANGGSGAPSAQTKTYGVNLTLSSTKPTRTGYNFLGWSTSSSAATASYSAGASFSTNANTTLYAVWSPITYTVTFNANGGSCSTASKSVTYASTYGTLPTPTRSGYAFAGWYTAASGGTQITASTTVSITANQTLYAHWTEIPVYISDMYYVSAGENGNGSKEAPFGTLEEAIVALGGKDGTVVICGIYDISEFKTDPWNGMITITGDTSASKLAIESNKFSLFNGAVTFDNIGFDCGSWSHFDTNGKPFILNGGENAEISSMIHLSSFDNALNPNAYAEFNSGTVNTVYLCGAYSTSYTNGVSGDSTLIVNGGTITSLCLDSDKYMGTHVGITVGRNLNLVYNGGTIEAIKYSESYKPRINGALNFIFNNGMEIPSSFAYPEDAAKGVYIIHSALGGKIMPTEDAGVFDVIPETGKVALIDGKTYSAGKVTLTPGEWDVTYVENSSYTVTFNANGGTCPTTSKTVTYGSTYGTLPTPTKKGCTCTGWYTASSGGTQITESTIVSITADQTLYAHWKANTYTVTFNANGGTCETPNKTVTYGSSYKTLPVPKKASNTFDGWYTALTDGTEVTESTKVLITTDQTLYAHWTENAPVATYTVAYNANGGTGAPAAQTKTHDVSLTLSTAKPTLDKNTFLGWATSKDGVVAYQPGDSYTANADVTLYAVWKADEPVVTDEPLIVVNSASGLRGDEITVTIDYKNNPGTAGMAFDVTFDESVLTLESCTSGIITFTTTPIDRVTNEISFVCGMIENVTGDGTLATLKFRISDTAEDGKYPITVSVRKNTQYRYEGYNELDFDLYMQNGEVEVFSFIPGDANGDGVVNNRDASRILQYLADWPVEIVEGAADANGDGVVNNRDASRILQYLADWPVTLGKAPAALINDGDWTITYRP